MAPIPSETAPSGLDAFFRPRSVAVVGASSSPNKVGFALLHNLLYGRMQGTRSRSAGFGGPVYPVNPKGGEILGERVYGSLSEIDGPVDLIVVAIPPRYVLETVEEAGEIGVRAAIVITAGFAELGDEGRALQDRLAETARRHGIRLIGPNCLGVMRPTSRLNASFAASPPPPGRIGLLSQSGALVAGFISYAQRERFGLSAAASLGAKADVEDEDVLRWLADDDETGAVALYVEALTEPRAFLDAARALTERKPVVAIKGGATPGGARAASSHTGSLAGSMAAYRAAFAQSGVLHASTIEDFVGWARALACQPPAGGEQIAILTNAGGPGVLSADAADRYGLRLAELSEGTRAALDRVLPAVWSHNNPVDVIGDAPAQRYRDALDVLGRAPEVDGIVLIMTVQAMTDPMETAQAISSAHEDPGWTKPLCCSFMGLAGSEVATYLDERGVPEFNMPETAVAAMAALARRGAWLRRTEPQPVDLPLHPAPDLDRARAVLAEARSAGQSYLDLTRATEVLASAGIRYNRSERAADEEQAVLVAEEIGYPVVVKLISPDVVHKSDVGGVVVGVVDAAGVRAACTGIRTRVGAAVPGARINGFTVSEQVTGTEIIVGMSRDPDFGSLMMVGMGGVFVEVYRDVAFRLVPLTRRDALDMVGEIRARALLDGARNRPVLDRPELAEILVRVSDLAQALPEIVELDVNPLVLTEQGLVAIDARVVVEA